MCSFLGPSSSEECSGVVLCGGWGFQMVILLLGVLFASFVVVMMKHRDLTSLKMQFSDTFRYQFGECFLLLHRPVDPRHGMP